MIRLMNVETGDAIHDPVNVGNPGEYTILELATKIEGMCGAGGGIVYRPLPEDDPTQRQPDITRARKLIGWEPTVTLEEGLRHTIAYFRDRPGRHPMKSNREVLAELEAVGPAPDHDTDDDLGTMRWTDLKFDNG
jgi:UDP-glucose 4-epimerase